ncbi:MAG: fasciclin domain-containing protein [Paludibacter sp.]|nr:fasciclin domain-containing protein [Paludibacter sp.]
MKHKYIIISVLIAFVSFTSCSDVWDTHYGKSAGLKSDLNLYDYIKTQPDLSKFSKMIDIAGFDTIINQPQTYTVWAPVNSSLEAVDLKDTAMVTDIVKNHISRFAYATSDIKEKTIFMLNKKFMIFKQVDGQYIFGGKTLLTANTAASNGILHTINGYIPYLSNIWEFIGSANGLDSLRAYLYSQSVMLFDEAASTEIGTNSQNQAVYDSVIVFSNPVLDRIGHIQIEDSLFAAILPNNAAWTKVYNKIKTNYKTLINDGGVKQRLNTQAAIVENLIFRLKSMNTEPSTMDSLLSTSGQTFRPSSYLFNGAQKFTLSNGLAYVTDSLRFKATESWQKKILVEAENQSYGRSFLYSTLGVRSGLGSGYHVSDNKFLTIEPTSVSKNTPASVTFPIPNTLSGKYKIYCVFVPSSIVNPDDSRRYKVKYNFSYVNSVGTSIKDAPITSKNTIAAQGGTAATFTTDSLATTKMYVADINFPFSNLYTTKSLTSDITTKLKVESAVVVGEKNLFDRDMRIDYIVLEPVE